MKVANLFKDSLYLNSFFLILNYGIMAFLGFIFWNIAARLFSVSEVGIASALISAMGLIMAFSTLGFNISLIKFFSLTKNKAVLISSCFILSGLVALVLSGLFLFTANYFYPNQTFIEENIIYVILFVIFAIFNIMSQLLESVFIAQRESRFVLVKNSLWSVLKILILFLFIGLSAFGIFLSWYISLILMFIVSWFLVGEKILFEIDFSYIKKMLNFSIGNYIGHIFSMLPSVGLPLFVTYFLGVENTAYFYISWMIAGLLFFIPQSIGKSFLSEGSNNKNDYKIGKTLKFNYIIIIPGIIIGILLSKPLLGFFGQEYMTNGIYPLWILLLSSLFYSFNTLLTMYYNLKQQIGKIVSVNALVTLFTFVISYLLLAEGIIGIAIAWLISNFIVTIFILIDKFLEVHQNQFF